MLYKVCTAEIATGKNKNKYYYFAVGVFVGRETAQNIEKHQTPCVPYQTDWVQKVATKVTNYSTREKFQ